MAVSNSSSESRLIWEIVEKLLGRNCSTPGRCRWLVFAIRMAFAQVSDPISLGRNLFKHDLEELSISLAVKEELNRVFFMIKTFGDTDRVVLI
jgi:hypothetical protein